MDGMCLEKKRVIITVKGKVQMGGFRAYAQGLANSYSLNGKIENLPNPSRDVQIDVEGEREKIDEFIEDLEKDKTKSKEEKKKKFAFEIDEILTDCPKNLMNYSGLEVVRKSGEMEERMDKGIVLLQGIRNEVSNSKEIELLQGIKNEFSGLHEQYGTINKTMKKVDGSLTKLNNGLEKISALPDSVDRLNENLEKIIEKVLSGK